MKVRTEKTKPETEVIVSLGEYHDNVSVNIEIEPSGDDWVVATLRKNPAGLLLLELAHDISDKNVATNDLGQIIVVDEDGERLN